MRRRDVDAEWSWADYDRTQCASSVGRMPHYLETDTIQSEEKLPVTKNAEQEDEGQINFIVRE